MAQPISGDASARAIARQQPIKPRGALVLVPFYGAGRCAPLELGGFADVEHRRVDGAICIPGGLSFLAFNDVDAPVTGLDAFPRADWPPVRELHLAFDAMVGAGTAMALIAVLAAALAAAGGARCPTRAGSCACSSRRGRSVSWRWSQAGWSPSGAANRGSYAARCARLTP